MCQLTYSNLHDPYINSLVVYSLAIEGSDEKHRDGCGIICSDNSIWKTQLAAHRISNLGELLFKFIADDKPIPFHIRYATFGIEVNKENAHPFMGDNYILMHNGTLIPKIEDDAIFDKKTDSDSQKFLEALDKSKSKKPKKASFDEIFNDAMNNFSGKFAFIIRDKNTNNDYIIRGRTAELWISRLSINGEDTGYVINTSKETMKNAFTKVINIACLTTGNTYVFSEPKLLDQERIFLAEENGIKEIGEAKETTPVKAHSAIVPFADKKKTWSYPNNEKKPTGGNNPVDKLIDYAERIYDFLDKNSLGILDLQILFYSMGGISLLELTKEDLQMFCDHAINKLSANKTTRKQVKKLLGGKTFPHELYEKFNLEFPWTVNESKVVLDALKNYDKIPF